MAGLSQFPAGAVLRAEDFDRARKFYTEVLGLEVANEFSSMTSEGSFRAGDGTTIGIYHRPGMPAPQNTTLSFTVPAERFEEVMQELRSRGVVFEEYDIPEIGLKTVNGVVEMDEGKAAWFKDSEGNIIVLGS